MEAWGYCRCCSGGCGEEGGAGGRSWGVRKEGRALRAEEVEVVVGGQVEGWAGEVGTAGEGVV
jgi:hypothetical protein